MVGIQDVYFSAESLNACSLLQEAVVLPVSGFSCCITLCNLFNFSEPQFPCL